MPILQKILCENSVYQTNPRLARNYKISKKKPHENARKGLVSSGRKILKTQKNCLSEYVGSELSLKRGKTRLRADVFGVSNQGENISVFV